MKQSFRKSLFMIALLSLFCTFFPGNHAAAQATHVTIQGVPLHCRDNRGALVPIYASEAVRKYGGAYAHFHPQRGFSITFSMSMMNSVNPYSAAFIFMHECAHTALPFGVGLGTIYQEVNADCYAIKRLVELGIVTNDYQLGSAFRELVRMRGSNSGHLPGPQRVQAALKCVK